MPAVTTATMLRFDATTHNAFTAGTEPSQTSHIVWVPDDFPSTAQALVLAARVEGFEVEALCGYRWVPAKNPETLPVCQRCLELYRQPGDNRDEREELPDA